MRRKKAVIVATLPRMTVQPTVLHPYRSVANGRSTAAKKDL